MVCLNCQYNNLESAVFCQSCGNKLPDHEGISARATPQAQPFRASAVSVEGNVVQLARRSLGDLIGQTISIYKLHFLVFFALAVIPQIPVVILTMLVPELGSGFTADNEGETFDFPQLGELAGTVFVLVVATIVLSLLSIGGIIYATGQHYLGRNVEFLAVLGAAASKFVALLLVAILLVLIFLIPAALTLILIGLPVLIFAMVRLYFAFDALVLEDLRPVDSIRRSWRLVEGHWWRTFGIGIIFFLMVFGATFVGSLLLLPLDSLGGTALSSIVSGLISAIVAPFMHIGATLVYLDLRVRQEGGSVKIVG